MRVGFQYLADMMQFVLNILCILFGSVSGDKLNPSDAGGNGAFADNVKIADVSGRVDVGAAAEFTREGLSVVFHADDPDRFAVFFAEQGHRAAFDGFVRSHDAGYGLIVFANGSIDDVFGTAQFLGGDLFGMRDVKTCPAGADVRSFLGDMISQNVAQSPMEQVGYRMVGADPCPVVAINFKTCNIAGFTVPSIILQL